MISEKKGTKDKVIIIILSVAILLAIAFICFVIIYNLPSQRLKRNLALGDKYLDELEYDEAVLAYRLALEIDPKSKAAYIGLADAYIGLDDYDMAHEVIEQGIEVIGAKEALLKKMVIIEEQISIRDGRNQSAEEKEAEQTEDTDISAEESRDSERNASEPEDDEEEIIVAEEAADEEYDVPSVLLSLSYGMTDVGEDYYIGNNPVWEIESKAEVIDKGSYFEVADVEILFYDYIRAMADPDYDWPTTNLGYDPITVRIRKDATVWYDQDFPDSKNMTAEDYVSRHGRLAPDRDDFSLWSNYAWLKFDDEWYITEISFFQS